MNKGIKTVIYPVADIAKAKALYIKLLGVEPIVDQPYYVGFRIEGQDIGLDPNGHKEGVTAYHQVDNIQESLQSLLDAGAVELQAIKDVGGGKQIAVVKDADGNIIGLSQG